MNRLQRVQALQQATLDYIGKEKSRIDNEVQVLNNILSGRTGGAGVQQPSKQQLAAVAQSDLNAYLAGP